MDFISEIIYDFNKMINDPAILMPMVNNRFIMILLVIVLLHLKYKTYNSMWASALVNIPGTLLHEFMHFIVGLVLNAQPSNFCLVPRKNLNGGYVMGSVGLEILLFTMPYRRLWHRCCCCLSVFILTAIGYRKSI